MSNPLLSWSLFLESGYISSVSKHQVYQRENQQQNKTSCARSSIAPIQSPRVEITCYDFRVSNSCTTSISSISSYCVFCVSLYCIYVNTSYFWLGSECVDFRKPILPPCQLYVGWTSLLNGKKAEEKEGQQFAPFLGKIKCLGVDNSYAGTMHFRESSMNGSHSAAWL